VTALGFIIPYPGAASLLESWSADAAALISEHQLSFRRAQAKAWNAYTIFLTAASANYGELVALNVIEEDLTGTWKIARAGIGDVEQLRAALLPLLPIQSAPSLGAVDMPAEIKLRTIELPERAIEAYLSRARGFGHPSAGGGAVKLAYVDLCGFRGHHKQLRIEFPDGFTVIDGRNGVGKSTIFDAVEFGVTGTITKYGDAAADRETIADYIWWTGEGPPPKERYVEVGFHDGNDVLPVRRTQLSEADPSAMDAVMQRLCDVATMPKSPLKQLCAAPIIRDEHIASLSLDMKEADRYALLCDAIGATDADVWIERGAGLASLARRRLQAAEKEVEDTAREIAAAGSRVDELRAGMMEETTVEASASRLQAFIGRTAPPDQLADPARTAIAEGLRQLEDLNWLGSAWKNAVDAEERLPDLRSAIATVENNKRLAEASLAALRTGSRKQVRGISLARRVIWMRW
jgi:AAA domain